MANAIPRALTALAVILCLAAPAGAETPPKPGLDEDRIGKIVRDYLLANPEVVEAALQALRAKREAEASARAAAAIRENADVLGAHPMSPVSGNLKGDVTVVEFFDYRCGFCKRALPAVLALLEDDRQVRVVWKEFPILGPDSRFAARASMAAARQGRYHHFHVRLMGAADQPTEEAVLRIAGEAGLDADRLRRDMQDPEIESYLDETAELARQIGIRGTPSFVIGGQLVRGAVDGARLKQLVAEARDAGGDRASGQRQ